MRNPKPVLGLSRRELVINWSRHHEEVKKAVELGEDGPPGAIACGPGWSYVTFFRPGADARGLLFDLDRLETVAASNGYCLPHEVVSQHNKLVVTAVGEGLGSTHNMLALYALLGAYATRYADERKHPAHVFYGKLGGVFERAEKGRVLALYSKSDDNLLAIHEAIEELVPRLKVRGVRFTTRLANGLSAVPRMLHGFDDPLYRQSGVDVYRISDPHQFAALLEQARGDYMNYQFGGDSTAAAASDRRG